MKVRTVSGIVLVAAYLAFSPSARSDVSVSQQPIVNRGRRTKWTSVRLDSGRRVYELKFEKINGTMKQYTGWARVEPWSEDGKRTLLTYSLKFEPETGAPVAVIDKGVWSVAIHVVKRIRLRLKALRKFNKVPKAWGGSS